jgi:hypothetical protein
MSWTKGLYSPGPRKNAIVTVRTGELLITLRAATGRFHDRREIAPRARIAKDPRGRGTVGAGFRIPGKSFSLAALMADVQRGTVV